MSRNQARKSRIVQSPDLVEVWEDRSGQFRWRRKAANSKTVSINGESLTDESHAVDEACLRNPGVKVIVLLDPPKDG